VRRIDRKGRRAPARVLDLELAPAGEPDDDVLPVERYSTLWCLSRVNGLPQEISFWDVTKDTDVRVQDLRDQLGPDSNAAGQLRPSLPAAGTASPPGPDPVLGVTGQASQVAGVVQSLGGSAVAQFRDDVFEEPPNAGQIPAGAWITFGALAQTLPPLRRFLTQSPGAVEAWSDRLGVDLAHESSLPRVLLSAALRRNTAGPVLSSTTRPERIQVAAEAAALTTKPQDAGAAALSELAATVRPGYPERTRTS
jgi:hypothetical protein